MLRKVNLTDGQVMLITRLLGDHKKSLQRRIKSVLQHHDPNTRMNLIHELEQSVDYAERAIHAVRFD